MLDKVDLSKPDPLKGPPLLFNRAAPFFMHMSDFGRLIRENCHPRFLGLELYASLKGYDNDAEAIDPTGRGPTFSVKAIKFDEFELVSGIVLPRPWIPYWSYNDTMDDASRNWVETEDRRRPGHWRAGKQPVTGWRAALAHMVKTGYLRPSKKLSFLIGRDTFELGADYNK